MGRKSLSTSWSSSVKESWKAKVLESVKAFNGDLQLLLSRPFWEKVVRQNFPRSRNIKTDGLKLLKLQTDQEMKAKILQILSSCGYDECELKQYRRQVQEKLIKQRGKERDSVHDSGTETEHEHDSDEALGNSDGNEDGNDDDGQSDPDTHSLASNKSNRSTNNCQDCSRAHSSEKEMPPARENQDYRRNSEVEFDDEVGHSGVGVSAMRKNLESESTAVASNSKCTPKKSQRLRRKPNVFTPSNEFILPRHRKGMRYCLCQKVYRKDEDDPMVQCSDWKAGVQREELKCKIWYHYKKIQCVLYEGTKFWLCPLCTDMRKSREITDDNATATGVDTTGNANAFEDIKTSDEGEDSNEAAHPSNYYQSSESNSTSSSGEKEAESEVFTSDNGLENTHRDESPSDRSSTDCDNDIILDPRQICEIYGEDESILRYEPASVFTLKFTAAEWSDIYDFKYGILRQRLWPGALNKKMSEVQQVCSFKADRSPYYGSGADTPYIRMNGQCCGEECPRQFRLTVQDKPWPGQKVIVEGQSQGKFKLVQLSDSTRQLRSRERKEIQKLLRHQKSGKVFASGSGQVDIYRLLHRNMTFKSRNSLRVAANESKNLNRAEPKNILCDVLQLQSVLKCDPRFSPKSTIPGLIQNVGLSPYRIDIYSMKQIKLAAALAASVGLSFYLDATGGITRGWKKEKNGKRIFYYALIARTREPMASSGEKLSFVVAEFCTEMNDQSTIQHFVSRIVQLIRLQSKKLTRVCDSVTCDFSFAMLHSVSLGINGQTLVKYIRDAWNILRHDVEFSNSKCVIVICVAHLLHAFSKNLASKGITKRVKQLALASLAKLHETSSFQSFSETVGKVVEVFQKQFIPAHEVRRFERELDWDKIVGLYESMCNQVDQTERTDDELHFILPNEDKQFPQREQSPFYHFFKSAREQHTIASKQTRRTSGTQNPYFCPEVLDILQNYYMAYYPLWGRAFIQRARFPAFQRSANAPVESYFKSIKHVYHPNKNEHPGDYLREHCDIILGIVNETLSKALSCKWIRATSLKEDPQINQEEQYVATEQWNKKSVRGRQPKHLSELNKKKETMDSLEEFITANRHTKIFKVAEIEGIITDLVSVLHIEWVNDMVINAYTKILASIHAAETQNIFIASTYLFIRLSPAQLDEIDKRKGKAESSEETPVWLRKYKISQSLVEHIPECRRLLIPFNDLDHWFLIDICKDGKEVRFHNSVSMSNGFAREVMHAILLSLRPNITLAKWKYSIVHCVKQVNGNDCGAHTLANIEGILLGDTQIKTPINSYRNNVAETLLNTTDAGRSLRQICDKDFKNLIQYFNNLAQQKNSKKNKSKYTQSMES